MIETRKSVKSKLTLSVDKEIIRKAKNLNLNLSEITESVLRSFTYTPNKTDMDSVYNAYQEMFDLMLPLLKEYETDVLVARMSDLQKNGISFDEDWYLALDGTFWCPDLELQIEKITSIPTYAFLRPKEILLNFINSLAGAKERRKEKLEEIELAKRILLAILESQPNIKSGKTKVLKEKSVNEY
jgi:hypothetical protein